MECYLMTGDADYLLRVLVRDVAAFERFIPDRIAACAGPDGTSTKGAQKVISSRPQ